VSSDLQVPSFITVAGAAWGLFGVVLLLAFAVFRLGGEFYLALQVEWNTYQWTALVLNLLFMAYSEGYKGFQLSYAPRVAARARSLLTSDNKMRLCLAPLFCMGYFHTTRRRLISSYVLTALIICAVLAFRLIPQPWRGVLDAGVALGLCWGLIALLIFGARALFSDSYAYSPELPEPLRS